MALLTKEQLQERFKLSRDKQQKKREAERKKKEAERKKRKEESDKLRKETMAELNKPKKINLVKLDTPPTITKERTITHYVVDDSSLISAILIGNLYETREELMEAEKRGEGKLNWEFFNKLVKEVRKELN